MRVLALHSEQHLLRGVLVDGGVVDHDLHHTVPDGLGHEITGHQDHLHHRVHVPAQVRGELLGENGDLHDDVFLHRAVRLGQVRQQVRHDHLSVGAVGKHIHEVQSALADGDISVLKALEHGALVHLHGLGAIELGHAGHGVQAQVADVGVLHRDKAAQQAAHLVLEIRGSVGTVEDDQVDGLEEDAVVSVALVQTLRHFGSDQNVAQDLVQQLIVIGHLVVLQQAQALHLQPRTGSAVIQVIRRAGAADHQTVQNGDHVGHQRLEVRGVRGNQAEHQTHHRGDHTEVAVLQQLAQALHPVLQHETVRVGAVEAQQTQTSLLADEGLVSDLLLCGHGHIVVCLSLHGAEDKTLHISRQCLCQVVAANVGHSSEGQRLAPN
mmetsp:Transcript_22947/g.39673  ORF Transcript_22947/g.39673 Transcript_22947/m.39673 type:complete len:380 (-) Transcript_22947:496-1635(-)